MNILVVDDEPDVRQSLSNFLEKLGHKVVCAASGMAGLKEFHQNDLDLVVTDIRMPGMDGLELLRRIKSIERSSVDVIVITGHGDMENAIQALKFGAFDYLQKPINVRELAITIERSREYTKLRQNYIRLKSEFAKRVEFETQTCRGEAEQLREAYLRELGLDGLYVFSEEMRQVVRQAETYSSDRSMPLLIEGESGTGKELVARYTHHYGQPNALSPFVAVNCGALSRDLMEAELFGHMPGAYTGATTTGRIGKFEAAAGGTIFFDEIGEMPLDLQVKLLRVLEDRKLVRLGGVKEIPVDVRIICATNKDLRKSVSAKAFRLDLFYRINTGSIKIPPLRERPDDIVPLSRKFISRAFARHGKKFENLTDGVEEFLMRYDWPGNVRQLKNAMERLALLNSDGMIRVEDLAFIGDLQPDKGVLDEKGWLAGEKLLKLPDGGIDLESLIEDIVRAALKKNNGNQTRTAQYLGISRRVLQGRLRKMKSN